VKRALLVGNSLGGAVSLRMAAQAPQRTRGLLLAAAATLGRETLLPFRLMTLPGLGELMTKHGPLAVRQQVKAIVHRPESITPDVLAAIERNVMRPGGAAHFLALLRKLTTLGGQTPEVLRRTEQQLQALRMPVTFVHGQRDAVLPAAHSQRAHQALAGSVLSVLQDCGHTPQLEQPQHFRRLLGELAERMDHRWATDGPHGPETPKPARGGLRKCLSALIFLGCGGKI
jgi:pimeloyl-ACP methyl ester carboxylesterase